MVTALGTRNAWIFKLKNCISGALSSLTHNGIQHKLFLQRNYVDVLQPPCLRDELLCHVAEPPQDGATKVTVVGAGMVGVACVNALLFQKISSHIAVIDAFPKKLKGEGLDYAGALPFLDNPRIEFDTDFCISTNSKVVIVTAGARQCKGESKNDLVQRNADIIRTVMIPLSEYSPKATFIIVTNPVDILTWVAWKVSGLPVNKVIGTGTHLDCSRFRCLIAERLGIAPKSVNAFIIGEHGETMVPLWSGVNAAGNLFREILPNIGLQTDEEMWYEVVKDTKNIESNIRCLKGYSNTAAGLATADITRAILRNEQSIKCISTLAQGHYNICNEVFLSLPCSIGENGISNVVRLRMTEQERKMLQVSADEVFKIQKDVKQ